MSRGPSEPVDPGTEVPDLSEREARMMVEALHGRRLDIAPGCRAFVFGWASFAVLYFLDGVDLAQISARIAFAVGVVVGLGFYWAGWVKRREMRADLKRLLGR